MIFSRQEAPPDQGRACDTNLKRFYPAPFLRLFLVSGFVILLDQFTKYFIKSRLMMYESITVIENFFDIVHVENSGGAFGLFANHSIIIRNFVFLFLSTIIALFVLWFYKKVCTSHYCLSIGIAMIFGGAAGNLLDRFKPGGSVVDFLDFYINNYHWPAFNVADSAICIGMAVLIYHIVFNKISDF